jgi:hypothetical protein
MGFCNLHTQAGDRSALDAGGTNNLTVDLGYEQGSVRISDRLSPSRTKRLAIYRELRRDVTTLGGHRHV